MFVGNNQCTEEAFLGGEVRQMFDETYTVFFKSLTNNTETNSKDASTTTCSAQV